MHGSFWLSIFSSSLVGGIVGAILGNWLSSRRERKHRLQEQRIQYLINAYRAFSKANHHPHLHEVADDLEQAVADIQLLGSPELISLAQRFSEEMGQKQEAGLDDVLFTIRRELRKELGEKPVSGKIIWLRIGR